MADLSDGYECGNHCSRNNQYTVGYPYLVLAVCKYLKEEVPDKKGYENIAEVWAKREVDEAVKILSHINMPLFDSMIK